MSSASLAGSIPAKPGNGGGGTPCGSGGNGIPPGKLGGGGGTPPMPGRALLVPSFPELIPGRVRPGGIIGTPEFFEGIF
jgi:hypothetical protein